MHILVVNDDGPPSNQSSPYVHSLVAALQDAGHLVSVVLPHVQRSWIGKAHMVGHTLTPTYYRPGSLLKDDGVTSDRPFNDGGEEWILIDGTPASCVQIGLHHVFKDRGPIDLVISGPNYGRNTTAVFALSSGTIGGAMEGAMSGVKSIALSYAFDSREHDLEIISAASRLSTRLIEKLTKEWPDDVHLYSINVPLRKGVENNKILYAEMIQNRWFSGSSFTELPEEVDNENPNVEEQIIRETGEANGNNGNNGNRVTRRAHRRFKWSPNFADVRKAVVDAGKGDGWEVLQGNITVTPLIANFWHLPHYTGEIKLSIACNIDPNFPPIYALIDYPDEYVQPLILAGLGQLAPAPVRLISNLSDMPDPSNRILQFTAYERIDFEHAMQHLQTSLVCSYVIRKALIRKHYLSNTVSIWLVKHPSSILAKHFKTCVHFELDYAEFLDEALVDAWDLNESLAENEQQESVEQKKWWILKPGMSDGGNGIRLFSTSGELQTIFEEWEKDAPDVDAESSSGQDEFHHVHASKQGETPEGNAMTSQLRHFIAQPYIDPPLLLESYGYRKFHIRAYVLAVGALKVYVYKEMLALFAAKAYQPPASTTGPDTLDLAQHLTNTCFQDEATKSAAVHRFWDLESTGMHTNWKDGVFQQICDITGEVFEAAAREQMIHFQTVPNAFEIFGVDFLIDRDCNVWLLELNAYPDFKQTGQDLQDAVVGGLFQAVTKTAIAPFFGIAGSGTVQMPLIRSISLGRC
ncbi:5'/3'-nucleotidase SurE [Cladophialophora bantiana CBS 173.52]|uniref:5'/3'-nucleotidase SurE n=1 Tax=Cladophialophora bantiana (strain ATCC 10958 / CBS 173.52 / CDC B-1940 / NIH 8579) TaxID=1442370 RepID=A0A0D2HSR9_CLAB1|nr:5'/3'-nucleotidase SurE [Cladophialophora bantiana CBS 173.52]KIW93920.1 5'/3'-nucleotidase SurE [Cladophialophora bantiana CBS 173.52]